MLFSEDMLKAVLEGRKTQTRRPVKDGETAWMHGCYLARNPLDCLRDGEVSRVVTGKPSRRVTKWRIGDTYSIAPGRGKHGVGRIRIVTMKVERAIEISESDARAEGFADREEFFGKLRSLYGASVNLYALYWVLEFELVQS